jgi:protein disulfide-isomerase A4
MFSMKSTLLLLAAAAVGLLEAAETVNIDASMDPKAAADQIMASIKSANGNEDAGAEQAGSDVIVLTEANFGATVTAENPWLVEFYAPWCGHCKSLAPEYEKAATTLSKGGEDDIEPVQVKLGKVDATVEKELGSKFDIQGYPALKIFKDGSDGKAHDYEGPRTADGIVDFMNKVADGTWSAPVDRVVTLTDSSFDEFIAEERITMVEFYAPWCGHCKKLAPEYEKAAGALWPKFKIAKVDSTVEKECSEKFEVSGYPTLKTFVNGKASDYDGERTAKGIEEEIRDLSKPTAKPLDSIFDTEQLTEKSDDITIIGYFSSEADAGLEIYQAAATKFRKQFSFYYTTTPKVINHYRGAKPGTVSVFKPKFYTSVYEKPSVTVATEGSSVEQLTTFFLENAYPLVGERRVKGANTGAHEYNQRPLVIAYADIQRDPNFRAESKVLFNQVAAVANKFKGKATFALSGETDYAEEMKSFGLADQDTDIKFAVMMDQKGSIKYSKKDEDASIEEFVQDALDGKLEMHIKSEPLPKKSKSPVKTVVGKTFDVVVNDVTKDVLIEFYAPWCGHCKSLAPEWKKLAKKLSGVTDLVVAKMDATANDIPSLGYNVEGFPTIYFASRTGKDAPIVAEGRKVNDFMKFLRKHATVELPAIKKKSKAAVGEKSAETPKDEL